MYIEPNTVVRLLNGIKLNNRYTDTINFSDVTAQTTYFSSKTKHTLDRNTYQRVNNGVFRCALSADSCYDCTYLMFQNTNYGSKWFYAFITKVEYVNNEMCNIHFEIDVMQTYWFDFTMLECMIEREHIEYDEVGANRLDEGFENNTYITQYNYILDAQPTGCVFTFSEHYDGSGEDGAEHFSTPKARIWENTPLLCELRTCDNTETSLKQFSEKFYSHYVNSGKANDLICGYTYNKRIFEALDTSPISITIRRISTIGDYTPRNKKLLQYPYTKLVVSNNCGETKEYYYEDFSEEYINFNAKGCYAGIPSVLCFPVNYQGQMANWDMGLTLSNYQSIAVPNDSYAQWLAQNKTGVITQALGSAIMFAGSMATGNLPLVATSGLNMATKGLSGLGQFATAKAQPDSVIGRTSGDCLNAKIGLYEFDFYEKAIPQDVAERIDSYFDMYGYKTMKVKQPNYYSRPHWNYVKTIDSRVNGSMPADDMKKVCDILDTGITFWKNGDEIGNYSLDNTP